MKTKITKMDLFTIGLIISTLYIMYQILRKVLGGSWTGEAIIAALLVMNITFTIKNMKDISKLKIKQNHLQKQFNLMAKDVKLLKEDVHELKGDIKVVKNDILNIKDKVLLIFKQLEKIENKL